MSTAGTIPHTDFQLNRWIHLLAEKTGSGISKIEAARRHIDTAAHMTFLCMDPLAIHTLIMAANGVLQDLTDKEERVSSKEQLIRPEKIDEFRKAMRKGSNFLKHANSDPHDRLKPITDFINDSEILWAIELYKELGNAATEFMAAYSSWFIVLYPKFVNDTSANRKLRDALNLPANSSDSRRELGDAIAITLGKFAGFTPDRNV